MKTKQEWKYTTTYLKLVNGEIFISPNDNSYTELKTWMENYGTDLIEIKAEKNVVVWRTKEETQLDRIEKELDRIEGGLKKCYKCYEMRGYS